MHGRLVKPLSARICAAGIAANLKYIFEWKPIVLVVAIGTCEGCGWKWRSIASVRTRYSQFFEAGVGEPT